MESKWKKNKYLLANIVQYTIFADYHIQNQWDTHVYTIRLIINTTIESTRYEYLRAQIKFAIYSHNKHHKLSFFVI